MYSFINAVDHKKMAHSANEQNIAKLHMCPALPGHSVLKLKHQGLLRKGTCV